MFYDSEGVILLTTADDWPTKFKGVKPGPERKALYVLYLKSAHWKAVRAEALERAEHSCMMCNRTKDLQVHHRTYERIGEERPADVIALCGACHERHHGITDAKKPVKKPKASKPKKKTPKWPLPAMVNSLRNLPPDSYTTKMLSVLLGIQAHVLQKNLPQLAKDNPELIRRMSKRQWRVRPKEEIELPAPGTTRRKKDKVNKTYVSRTLTPREMFLQLPEAQQRKILKRASERRTREAA